MDEIDTFIEAHRPRLLRYLDGKAPQSDHEPDALAYIDAVLEEWSRKFGGRKLRPRSHGESTFWFALYQLEEVEENRAQGAVDPYQAVLLENLALVRERLRKGRELPHGFCATRPGETFEAGMPDDML